MEPSLKQICVYAASSADVAPVYLQAAQALGRQMAAEGVALVYGGGGTGLMGAVADAVLAGGGQVTGIMPHFMRELEWAHSAVADMRFVADMHERKRSFLLGTDAVVALPGGCGTLEELLEVITWRRLGLFAKPIVIVNTAGYYAPLLQMLNLAMAERFMPEAARAIWHVVDQPEQVLPALRTALTLPVADTAY